VTQPPRFLHPFARPAAGPEAFVTIVRGDGAHVWDELGNKYIDAMASLWYCNAGHGRVEIIEAVHQQMQRLDAFHTFDRFTNESADSLADELCAIAPMPDARVFLTSSGSEAVESALKLARIAHAQGGAPERTVIISRVPSYHGVTFGALSATGLPLNQAGFGPLVPDVIAVPYDDLDALDEVLRERGDELAAIIAEPVIGAGGVHPPAPGYLQGLRERCDRYGGFLIFDEVICGFGRLGPWWGADHFGVTPDLVTFAKGVTSGYLPLGGVLVGAAVRAPLEADGTFILRHGHTYSGHPASCAAGRANMAVIKPLLGRAQHIGDLLSGALHALADGNDRIVGVRGEAGMWAAALNDGVNALDVREEMMARGVIARPLGPSLITFCPPLLIDDADVELSVEALGDALATVSP
jgi:putrescine---pyruvate transaminase